MIWNDCLIYQDELQFIFLNCAFLEIDIYSKSINTPTCDTLG